MTLRLMGILSWINFRLAYGAAWPGWPITILVIGTAGVTFRLYDIVLYILSVQASIATAVSDIRQRAAQAEDERRQEADQKRDALLVESVDKVSAVVIGQKELLGEIHDMMEASERRDRIAAKRDKMILTAFEANSDLFDYFRQGGLVNDRKTETRPAARRKRTPHGRTNRKKQKT